jgi:hypothetical protein
LLIPDSELLDSRDSFQARFAARTNGFVTVSPGYPRAGVVGAFVEAVPKCNEDRAAIEWAKRLDAAPGP